MDPKEKNQMEHYICKTCGTQYAAAMTAPDRCRVCEDDRQYVGWHGQEWTTLAEMRAQGYRNEVRPLEPGLFGIGVEPVFAIGQRSLLVVTPEGNVLWDPVSYMDERTIAQITGLGGIQAISVSHPHFYTSMVEWSHAFNRAPIYLPVADRTWVMRPDPVIKVYEGALALFPGVTLVQCGGHFPGSAVLHWAEGARGRGALLTGDTIMVVQDRRYVSFMYSFPNLIPLPPEAVVRIVEAVMPYHFDRIYGGWWEKTVSAGAMDALVRSARRYIRAIEGKPSLLGSPRGWPHHDDLDPVRPVAA
jgi:glyoxylase-like metal-dependent hydrolase (beta-lactamase superfamily II)